MKGFRSQENFQGFNVTVPFKEIILPYVDYKMDVVQSIGAINTVIKKGEEVWGDNTDIYGVLMSICPHIFLTWDDQEKRISSQLCAQLGLWMESLKDEEIAICLFGYGGAARSLLYACQILGDFYGIRISVSCFYREQSLKKIETLENLVKEKMPRILWTKNTFGQIPETFFNISKKNYSRTLIVNTTSLGLSEEDDLPFCSQDFSEEFWKKFDLFDMVYTKGPSLWQRKIPHVRKSISGQLMLATQAAASFALWHDVDFEHVLEKMIVLI